MIKGKTIEEAAKISNQDIANELGGLPKEKMHCSVMGMEALEAAIKNYNGAKNEKVIIGEDEKIICKCFNVSEKTILKAIELNNIKTVDDITNFTKAGGGCGKCKGELEKILKDYWKEKEFSDYSKMTVVEKIKRIEKVLNEEINPKLKSDGGWLELVDIENNMVKVRFLGMCKGCPSSSATLKEIVEKELREKISSDIKVIAV